MRTAMALVVGLSTLLWSVHTPETLAAQESMVDVIKEQLRYDEWLSEDHAPTGYEFKQSDYSQLDSMTIGTDKTSVGYIQWDVASSGYVNSVRREVSLSGDNSTLGITLTVAPTAARAKESLLLQFEESSAMPTNVRYAGDFGYSIGSVALLLGVKDDAETITESEIKSIKFARYNVVVEMNVNEASTLPLTELAYAIDAKIKAQAETAEGAKRPSVTLTLESDSVNTTGAATGTSFNVNLTHSVSGFPDGTVYGKYFYSGSKSSTGYDGKGRVVVAASPDYFGATSGLEFDDTANPGKIVVLGTGSRGSYKVGYIAWGPNLLPKIVTDDLEVEG